MCINNETYSLMKDWASSSCLVMKPKMENHAFIEPFSPSANKNHSKDISTSSSHWCGFIQTSTKLLQQKIIILEEN